MIIALGTRVDVWAFSQQVAISAHAPQLCLAYPSVIAIASATIVFNGIASIVMPMLFPHYDTDIVDGRCCYRTMLMEPR